MISGRSKVFGIGLSKTGTTSLNKAFGMLGMNAVHFPIDFLDYSNGSLAPAFDIIDRKDAFTDIPISRFYRELDQRYTGSKFILTVRDIEKWLDSCNRHFWPGQIIKGDIWINRLHLDLYDSIDFDEARFREAYYRHLRGVMEYFEGRDDLLVMNITGGDGWEKLCPFLGVDEPDIPFPRADCLYTNAFRFFRFKRVGRFIQNYKDFLRT